MRQKLLDYENHFPDIDYSSVALLHNGREKCLPGKQNGPYVCDHFLFHLILSGRGELTLDGRDYSLQTGQGFLIAPGQIYSYRADEKEPWEYAWLGFRGEGTRQLLFNSWLMHTRPVYESPRWRELEGILDEGLAAVHAGGMSAAVKCQGLLFMALAHLIEETRLFAYAPDVTKLSSVQLGYVSAAIEYVRRNVSAPFTVSDISASLGLNRSYFSRLFTRLCGCAPAAFILNYRLDLAWHMLRHTGLHVSQIARETGFDDAAYFTRRFTARYGEPPSHLRAEGNRAAGGAP